MSSHPASARIDTRDPLAAAEYLRICRDVLANLNVPEAMARFLEEMAGQFEGADEALALHLRQQAQRIGTGQEVRHAVRAGVPPAATVRAQVMDRLRREEEQRRGQAATGGGVLPARGCLVAAGGAMAAGLGASVWGLLWLVGVDWPWGPLLGTAAGLVMFGVFLISLKRAVRHLIRREEEDLRP